MTDGTFSKFPAETVGFLKDLKANNTRAWFAENKAIYERAIKHPADAFGITMAARLEALTGLPHRPKIFRIHRDIRFSKDKTPYNGHLHVSFRPEIDLSAPPQWFFALETDRLVFGAGVFGFEKAALNAFRERVLGPEGAGLTGILDALQCDGVRLGDAHLKRVPAGYPKDHPRAALLKHKGLTAWTDVRPPEIAAKPRFMKVGNDAFTRLQPLFDWLATVS